MTIKHNAEFERAVRIEMLRANAALERRRIAQHGTSMAAALNPSQLISGLLPSNTRGWVSRGLSLVTRYPHVLTSVLLNRRFKRVRWMSVAALAVGAWAMLSGRTGEDPVDD
ncbi:MAG TPA: hypothetical protein VIC30_08100 [Orrella sp.]